MRFVVTQFLSAFWIYQPTAFWHPRFLMRNLFIILSVIPYMWWVTFLLLSRFSLSLDSLIIMCLSEDFLDWFYPTWSSLSSLEDYMCVFHHIWDVFTHYFFKQSAPFSLSFRIPTMHMLICLMLSHRSFSCSFQFFSIFFSSRSSTWQFQLSYLQISWFFCLLKSAFESL